MSRENSRIVKTKKALKEAVVELLKQGDVSLINVFSICQKAGINRTTFYNHYKDKDALLKEMVLDTVDASCDFLDAFLEKKNPGLAMTRMLQYYRGNDGFFLTLMMTDYADAFVRLMIDTIWEKCFLWYKRNGDSTSSYVYYRIVFKVSGVVHMILHWLEGERRVSLPMMSSFIMSFLLGNTTETHGSVDLEKKCEINRVFRK